MGTETLALTAAFALSLVSQARAALSPKSPSACCMSSRTSTSAATGTTSPAATRPTNPGVKVEVQYLENEAYKKKLTTLLQSPDKPNIIYSWGGGVLREQVKAGVHRGHHAGRWTRPGRTVSRPAAVQAYTVQGKVYGVPMHTSQVGFFYNKDLFAKAGVDAASIKTWDDFLAAVKKLQDAGIVADRHRRRRQVAGAFLLVASRHAHRRQGRLRGGAQRRGQGLRGPDLRQGGRERSSSSPTSSRSRRDSSARPIRNRPG